MVIGRRQAGSTGHQVDTDSENQVPRLLDELARVEWQFFTDWRKSKAK